jgi:hypothetical protein
MRAARRRRNRGHGVLTHVVIEYQDDQAPCWTTRPASDNGGYVITVFVLLHKLLLTQRFK